MPPKQTNMKTRKPTGKNSGSTSALAPSSDISSATLEPKSKLPKFKKKLADPLVAPPDPTPIYFKQNLNKVRGECPTSQRHFISIQDWVLEYTNTLWESDASPNLLELLNPQPRKNMPSSQLIILRPPSVVSQFRETMHRYDFDPFYDVARAWLSPLTWAFFDKLCTRHMYTRNSPHIPYLPQHRFPFQEVVQRGSYALDFFLGCSWLITMRKALINAFDSWSMAPTLIVTKALIESGQDSSLPGDVEQSFAKIMAYRKIVRIEDTLAEVQAVMQLLMHRTLNHIALVAGLELPCFGVDHNLVGAFISMDNPNVLWQNWSDMVSPFMVSGSWSPENAVDAPVTSAVDAPALTTDPIHYFGFEGEEGYSSEEPSDDDFMKKHLAPIHQGSASQGSTKGPPLGSSHNRLPHGILGNSWSPRAHSLYQSGRLRKSSRVYHSGLEHYVLERWSSAPPGPPGYPKRAKKCHHLVNADQGPIDRPKSAQHEAEYGPSRGWSQSCSPVWGEEYLESECNHAEHNCAEHDCVDIPPTLMQGHLFDVHSPPLVPHVFPTRVLAILWVLLTIIHGLVIIACTLLAIICHLSITHVLVNIACILVVAPLLLTMPCILLLMTGILVTACLSWPLFVFPNASFAPLASPHVPPPDRDFPSVQGLHHDGQEPENSMLEDQAPEVQTPGTESNETAEASPVNLDPPIFVGDWFHIEFSSITGDVNIREVFKCLSEDHLFSVRVWKNKGGKGLACLKKKNSPGSRLFDFKEATKIAVAHQESIASFRWVLDPDYVEMCYAHQQSADDLTLMLENAPTCREIGDLHMLHLFPPPLEGDSGIWTFIQYHFLDLHCFPPLVADEVEYPQCMLDRVEFTTAWFLATLDQEYDVIWCHLKMINLLALWVPLYITHGLYDVLVHEPG
ncbi:hypothetical protein BS47DRAFT_1369021 [Hydnum rufescens UP504]|uniref:Uncharacterized protein n=1 Tax=Hydnum rufescens UP504 TaxID=1448309 RepID=A0A9P6DMH5_9AGAM|nr:hypothetical protein BS47DRAFT_1369021 [Hydnum rufescens UP504]